MVLYLDRMCQCRLHAVLWSHICTFMHRLAAEPRSSEGLLVPSQCLSGTILLTPYSMVWDWRVSRASSKLMLGLRVGFISSHVTVDQLFPGSPREITGPPKMSLLLEAKSIPNQPHLLNKYQINMGFSHFREFGILSGMYTFSPHQIDIVK